MNQEKEKHLEEIFRRNDSKGIAIAITGSWGVGKTFFWNKFLRSQAREEQEKLKHLPASERNKQINIFNKKYAYISLFGIENLADLKTAICTNLSSNFFNEESVPNLEMPVFVKKMVAGIKDVKVSGFGLSSSARIIENLLFLQIKDAIICFDDFERMSSKLDIKDVMGLANQLKLEKNCQVILILDESKTGGENKKNYSEYKEKLIDEDIKITSVEPLIHENAKDIDEPLVDFMIEFAEKLEIHNFRFFQKVIKLYRQFLEQLPDEIAYSTKEIILIRILQGYFIEESGLTYEFHWHDVKLVLEDKQQGWSKIKIKTYESLKSLNYYFIYQDQWMIEFKKWFEQRNEVDFESLKELAKSELTSERNQNLKNKIWDIFERRFNFNISEEDFKFLTQIGAECISNETIYNTSVAYEFIKKYLSNEQESEKFKQDVLKIIDGDIGHFISRRKSEVELWNNENNIFYDYIDELALKYQEDITLKEIISYYLQYDQLKKEEYKYKLKDFLLEDWYHYLTVDIYKEKFFLEKEKTTVMCLRRLCKVQVDDFNLKNTIIDVLNQIGNESEFKRRYMQDIIENHLD